MKDNNTPEIRFSGFENEWEERKLGEVYKTYSGQTPLRSDALNFENPTTPWIKTMDLENGEILHNEENISDKGAKALKLLPVDTVLIAMYGGFNQIGRTGILTYRATINQALTALEPNEKVNAYFLITELNYRVNDWKTFAASSRKDPNITKKDVEDFILVFPSLPEQIAISNFFRVLDNTITLHQRELDNLKQMKQGFLQKMFPKEGERVPELRLPRFSGDWERRKLGEVGSVAMCKRIFKEQTNEVGEISFFKIGTFGGVPDSFISKELFNEYRSKYSFPEIGDILISASGTIGRTVVYSGEESYYQDSNIVWLKCDKNKLDNSFLKQFYQVVKWAGIEGSTIKRLYNNNILSTEISLPSLQEQIQVGHFLKQLDDIITLHQKELDILKETKKAFLQKMFV